jgi:hypothetical protein
VVEEKDGAEVWESVSEAEAEGAMTTVDTEEEAAVGKDDTGEAVVLRCC